MEKNNQPLIIGALVVGAVLIIALALIFTRDDSGTEAPAENTASENEENATNENGENGGEQTTPQPDPQPTPQPAPDPDPLPDPQPDPQPQPGVLPPNWNSLTDREKTNLNPFDCNHETQWVSAEDGSCIDKPSAIFPFKYVEDSAQIECYLTVPSSRGGCTAVLQVEAIEDIQFDSGKCAPIPDARLTLTGGPGDDIVFDSADLEPVYSGDSCSNRDSVESGERLSLNIYTRHGSALFDDIQQQARIVLTLQTTPVVSIQQDMVIRPAASDSLTE